MLLIFTTVFFVMALFNFAVYRFVHWLSLIVFLVPPAVLLGIFLYKRKHEFKRLKSLNVVLAVVFVFVSIGNFGLMITDDSMSPSRDVHAYERIMKAHGYPGSKGVAHFPSQIPADSQNVQFYDMPAWIDGPYIYLRYQATTEEITDMYNKYSTAAKKVVKLSDTLLSTEELPSGMKFVLGSFHEVGYEKLPEDFDLIFIDFSPAAFEESTNGCSYGLAVSRQRNEVICFYERWG